MQYLGVALIGLCSGITSGLLGVGGGIIMVPAMILLLHLNPKTAIGTSLAVIIPTALVGSFKHYHLGNLDLKVALILAPLAIVGGYMGAQWTAPLSADTLKRLFGGFLVIIGLYMIFSKPGYSTPPSPAAASASAQPQSNNPPSASS